MRRLEGGDFDEGFPGFGDDEGFAFYGVFDESRELGFGFVDVDDEHSKLSPLN